MRPLMRFLLAICSVVALAAPAWAQSTIRDTEIEDMLHDYEAPILQAANLNPESIHIYVLNSKEINAFVSGGQNIFIHTGIILESKTPDELIGVMAHETGHIAGGHLARSDAAMATAARPMLLTMGLGVLAAVAGEPGAGAALIGSAQQFGALNYMAYSRVQESAADQAAANFLEKSHQSGEGLLKFYKRFQFQEVMSGANRYPYFRTHPLSSQRIEALSKEVTHSEWYNKKDSPAAIHRLKMVKAKIVGFLESPQQVFNLYPETDTSMPARYARAIANYRAAATKTALEQIAELIKEEPDNPYFEELYGQVLFESGKAQEAIKHHERSVQLDPKAPLLHLNLAQALVATKTTENIIRAKKELDYVLKLEPGNSFAWYQMSLVHEAQGHPGLAKLATAEQSYAMGDYMRAKSFAERAKHDLQPRTVAWRRANDITLVIAADPRIRKAIERQSRPPSR